LLRRILLKKGAASRGDQSRNIEKKKRKSTTDVGGVAPNTEKLALESKERI